ncbi:unnamed protein product, partial [Pleuronectes platessa]
MVVNLLRLWGMTDVGCGRGIESEQFGVAVFDREACNLRIRYRVYQNLALTVSSSGGKRVAQRPAGSGAFVTCDLGLSPYPRGVIQNGARVQSPGPLPVIRPLPLSPVEEQNLGHK